MDCVGGRMNEPIYTVRHNVTDYQWLGLDAAGSEIRRFLDQFRGQPLGESFWHPNVERLPDEMRLPMSDSPCLLPGCWLLSDRAAERMRDVWLAHGELHRVAWTEGTLWAFNTCRVIDAVDLAASELGYVDGKLDCIYRYNFCRDAMGDALVFKIPQFLSSPVFVTESFVRRVAMLKLTGFRFHRCAE